jgi:D-lactate dehydrogenase (cytochrome)
MMSAILSYSSPRMPLPSLDSIFFKFQNPTPESIAIVSEITKKHGGQDLVFAKNDEESEELWAARKAAHWAAMSLVEGGTCYSTDVCVPVGKLPELVRETKEDLERNGIVGPLLG